MWIDASSSGAVAPGTRAQSSPFRWSVALIEEVKEASVRS